MFNLKPKLWVPVKAFMDSLCVHVVVITDCIIFLDLCSGDQFY